MDAIPICIILCKLYQIFTLRRYRRNAIIQSLFKRKSGRGKRLRKMTLKVKTGKSGCGRAAGILSVAIGAAVATGALAYAPAPVVFDTPAADEKGAMILGNGEVGALAWITADGTLHTILQGSDTSMHRTYMSSRRVLPMPSPSAITRPFSRWIRRGLALRSRRSLLNRLNPRFRARRRTFAWSCGRY